MESEFARGGIETVMITFMLKNTEVENIFKYLESKTPILEDFSREIKELEELPQVLHDQTKFEDMFTIGSTEFREEFLTIYNHYTRLYLYF